MNKPTLRFTSAAITDRGLSDKRPNNEDSYLELVERGLFAVADGVGGAQAGDVASNMAMEMLFEAFSHNQKTIDPEDLMEVAIQRANASIYQMAHDLPQLSTMATTIVALHLVGNVATIGHVGDSRLYRLDAGGNLFRETQDHSIVEEEVRAGRMTQAQAATHPSRNVISRALGAEEHVEVDMKTIMFEIGTTFLLCSDGITRHLSDPEIREILLTCPDTIEICRQMKNLCFSRGAEDNLTAVVIKVDNFAGVVIDPIEEDTIIGNHPKTTMPLANGRIFTQQNNQEISIPTVPAPNPNDGAPFRVEGSTGVSSDDDNRIYEKMVAERQQIVNYAKGGLMGRLLRGFFLFGLGCLVGASALFFITQLNSALFKPTAPPSPALVPTESPNIPFSAFEKSRREVDKNPEQFLKAQAETADDSEDFYLRGRAFLLIGDEKKSYEAIRKAKELLPQMPESLKVNRETLQNEIALISSILADSDATTKYKRLTAENRTTEAAVGASSNANAN